MPHVSLFVRTLYDALQAIIERKELTNARVAHKINASGELVIAIIVPPPKSDPHKWRAHE